MLIINLSNHIMTIIIKYHILKHPILELRSSPFVREARERH